MTKRVKETTLDKIQRSLYHPDPDKIKLSKEQDAIRQRYIAGFTFWSSNPFARDSQVVNFIKNSFSISRRQAQIDLVSIKRLMGNVALAPPEWYRYQVIEMAQQAFLICRHNNDGKGMAIAADKITKAMQLDRPESDKLPWDQIIPPNFEPSPDISILGFKRDPNIEERRKEMREKYLRQYDPNAISDAEIIE